MPSHGRFQKAIEGLKTLSTARVTADYYPEGQTEITLKTGSEVRVLHKFDSGWWLGECDGYVGHFPAAFVQENEAASSSPRSASPALTESRDPKRRQMAIQEIYETEKSYLESLEVLFDQWVRPLQLKGMLKEEESRAMFQGLDAIKDCAARLVNELKPQLEQSSVQLGDIFLALVRDHAHSSRLTFHFLFLLLALYRKIKFESCCCRMCCSTTTRRTHSTSS